MEAKDVALLGFVSAAQKYVEKHIDDSKNLGDLENVDINRLKDELSKQLKFLVMPEDQKIELLLDGQKAFDEYAAENLEPKNNVIEELGQIFNVNFDDVDVKPITKSDDIEDEPVSQSDDIDELLEAYDIDESETPEVIIEKVKSNEQDEFGLTEDDDILLTIANAAAKSDEELAKEFNKTEVIKPKNLDSAFAEVINNEDKEKEEIVEEENAEPEYNKQVNLEQEHADKERVALSKLLKGIGKTETENTGYFEYTESRETPKQKESVKPVQNTKPQGTLSSELRSVSENTYYQQQELSNKQSVEETKPQTPSMNILVNPGLEVVLEQEGKPTFYNVSREEERATTSEKTIDEKPVEHTLSEALSGLGRLQRKQEENYVEKEEPEQEIQIPIKPQIIKEEEPETKQKTSGVEDKVYSNIMLAYPYLTKDFIVSAYDQKDEISTSYVKGDDYIILHRLTFTNVEELREFVEIMMAHNYLVNVDEKKMIVDTIREFTNREGTILTNIFSIANQAKILNGEYEGYCVINKKGK